MEEGNGVTWKGEMVFWEMLIEGELICSEQPRVAPKKGRSTVSINF